jgi:hypothetical protein
MYIGTYYLGSFSYQFNTLGTYYYWTPLVYQLQEVSMRGMIDVVPSESEILTVEGIWNNTWTGKV